MKIRPVLADTGRPSGMGATVSLLNAGWNLTTGVVLPTGGWTLPQQALTLFLEAEWSELNKLHHLVIELVSDDGQPAYWVPGQATGAPIVRMETQVVVAPVPGAPAGTPGSALVTMDMPAGVIWLPAPGRRYTWKITCADLIEEINFWVQAPAQARLPGGNVVFTPAASS